jgi:membrane fusion protein (multidrug efflux system)
MKKTGLIILLAALLLSACGKQEEKPEAETKPAAPERSIVVTATEVKTQPVPIVLESVGEIQSIDAPTIGAEIPGRITQVKVDVGDVVKQGALLGRLDRSGIKLELDVARAEQGRVEALITNQKLVVKRLNDLKKNSFVSTSDIDEADAQLRSLRKQLEVTRARVELAEYQLSKTNIKAPMAGKIDHRFISVGDYVKDGAALFTIADTESLRLVTVFPEPAMRQLHKGTPLKVVTAVDPSLTFDAAISEIRPRVETANKGVVAYADLTDPSVTRAGSSAAVWATLAVHKDSIVVPQQSLVRRPAGEVVYVIDTNNHAHELPVTSGARLENGIEITNGLKAGERVAVDGAGFLSDKAKVEIK